MEHFDTVLIVVAFLFGLCWLVKEEHHFWALVLVMLFVLLIIVPQWWTLLLQIEAMLRLGV